MTNHPGLPWTIQVLSLEILHLRNSLTVSKPEQLVTLHLLKDSIFQIGLIQLRPVRTIFSNFKTGIERKRVYLFLILDETFRCRTYVCWLCFLPCGKRKCIIRENESKPQKEAGTSLVDSFLLRLTNILLFNPSLDSKR